MRGGVAGQVLQALVAEAREPLVRPALTFEEPCSAGGLREV